MQGNFIKLDILRFDAADVNEKFVDFFSVALG
jgi:hypothetical protein